MIKVLEFFFFLSVLIDLFHILHFQSVMLQSDCLARWDSVKQGAEPGHVPTQNQGSPTADPPLVGQYLHWNQSLRATTGENISPLYTRLR